MLRTDMKGLSSTHKIAEMEQQLHESQAVEKNLLNVFGYQCKVKQTIRSLDP